MAQRTDAERFLASAAKSASAGLCLALALAALGLAGCGGSSDRGSATAAGCDEGTATAAGPGAQGGDSAGGSEGQGGQSEGASGGGGSGSDGAGSDSSSSPQGAKHGPRIAQPKGPREHGPTPAQLANATVADISLTSPAIVAANGEPGSLAPTYTCDGADSWPALRWSGVPEGTAELALYAMNVQPVEGQLFVDWAVAGLDPSLEGIEAGKLPRGAIIATNGFGKRGYSLCPEGSGEIYMFALYALPTKLDLRPGFDAREARHRILDVSGNVGLLPALYAHG